GRTPRGAHPCRCSPSRETDFPACVLLVRGLHYRDAGAFLPENATITVFDPPEDVMDAAAQLEGGDLSNGLLYRRFRADDGRTWWFCILWGQVNLAAVVEAPVTASKPHGPRGSKARRRARQAARAAP